MNVFGIVGGFLIIVACIVVIICTTLLDSKSGLGTIAGEGGGGSFFDQNRGKTKEAMLKRATWVMGAALVALTLIVLFVI